MTIKESATVEEGDYLTLADGTYCRVEQGWHGRDNAWLVVAFRCNGVSRKRSVERSEIAGKSLAPYED